MLPDEEEIGLSRSWVQKEWEEGWMEGREQILKKIFQTFKPVLLEQIEQRFGDLSEETRRQVETINSVQELAQIFIKILKAGSLADLDIPPLSGP